MTDHSDGVTERKRVLRRRLLAARAARPAAARAQAGRALAAAGLGLLRELSASEAACYISTAAEPPTAELLAGFEVFGVRALLPVVTRKGLLDWAPDTGPRRPGPFGLTEPGGDPLGTAALGRLAVAFLPALAVDRAGHRLGRGGGYVDRALRAARPGLALAVVYDDEILDELPWEPADQPVDGVLAPGGLSLLD